MSEAFKRALLVTLVALVGMQACDRKQAGSEDPTGRLTGYINKSFSVKGAEDKQELLSFLTGDAKTRLASWSDEQFRQAFVESKRSMGKLLIRETKNVSPDEVNITYELSYTDQAKGKDVKVTNKKLCQLIREQGKWYIRDVRNIKELIEYKDEMSLP